MSRADLPAAIQDSTSVCRSVSVLCTRCTLLECPPPTRSATPWRPPDEASIHGRTVSQRLSVRRVSRHGDHVHWRASRGSSQAKLRSLTEHRSSDGGRHDLHALHTRCCALVRRRKAPNLGGLVSLVRCGCSLKSSFHQPIRPFRSEVPRKLAVGNYSAAAGLMGWVGHSSHTQVIQNRIRLL
jgi:hypothetical protein